MTKSIFTIFIFVIGIAIPINAKENNDDTISANEFELIFELSSDTIFADGHLNAAIYLISPYEISKAIPTGEAELKNFELLSSSEPRFLGRKQKNRKTVYVYLLDQYSLKPTKAGRLKIKSSDFDIVALSYERVSDGFFYYKRTHKHQVHLKGISTQVTVLSSKDLRIDTRRYPTEIAQMLYKCR